MVRLVLTWKGHPLAFELRPGLNTFGRNPTNHCRISDPSISSFHAEIHVDGESIRVRDLGSTNGTFIGGERIREAVLPPGKPLRMGTAELHLEEVLVTTAPRVPQEGSPTLDRAVPLARPCAYHPDAAGSYQCENCAGVFCEQCVTIVGHDRLNTMTICPVCGGQANNLAARPAEAAGKPSFLRRLTQTLKIPFAR